MNPFVIEKIEHNPVDTPGAHHLYEVVCGSKAASSITPFMIPRTMILAFISEHEKIVPPGVCVCFPLYSSTHPPWPHLGRCAVLKFQPLNHWGEVADGGRKIAWK